MYFAGLLVFFVTIIYGHAAYFDNYDYCNLPCENGFQKTTHVKCERKDCGVDHSNCYESEPIEMTDKLKQFILDEHNKLRNKVASGQERLGTNGPQPEASNMLALKYNDELASAAQCWANTCRYATHSNCHRAKNLPHAGQNIAHEWFSNKDIYNDLESVIKRMIFRWYDEVKFFNRNFIKPFNFNYATGHYTIMVWGVIQEIGCGLIKFNDAGRYTVSLVCNYGSGIAPGNFIGAEMYKVGQPCSACPEGKTCNSKYNALCGEDTLDFTGASRRNIKIKHKTRKSCIKH